LLHNVRLYMTQVKSVKRAFEILGLYTISRQELSMSEVTRELGMNKSTAARLMATLESVNMLKRCSNRKYCLDGMVMETARVFLSNLDLKAIASPYLIELNKKTNDLVSINVIRGDKRFCLDYIESSHPVRYVVEQDHIYSPLHAGAPGKLLLAYLPDNKIEEIIKRTGLPRYTNNTITKREDLKKEIESIRENGIAISKGEHVKHACTVSAPIRDYKDKVVAALSISWIMIGDTSVKEQTYPKMVKEVANSISRELGYHIGLPSEHESNGKSRDGPLN